MRIVGPMLALLGVLAWSGTARAGAADAACQRQVARAGAKFAGAALKIGQRCAMHAAAGGLSCRIGSAASSGDRGTDAALGRAAGRLAARVADACAAADLAPFGRRCADPTGPPLTVAELVRCLHDTHLDRVGMMVAVEFPAPKATAAAGIDDGCQAPQVCQCRCASPSGAFVLATGGDAL